MKTMSRLVAALCVIVMVALLCIGCSQEKKETFKIGMSGPLTGGAAQYGIAVQNGASLAIEEINANGGLFGYELELLSFDDQHKSDRVMNGYADMMEKGMQVSLGCVTSAPCAEFKKYAKDDKLFFLTPSATNDEVPSEFNGYQICFADGNQGKAAAAYVNEAYKNQTIGVLYCKGDNYSEGIYNQFTQNLDASITVVSANFPEKATDFSQQIATLKDCEFVFMPIYYDPASQFMIQAKNFTNSFKVFYGCDGLDGIDAIDGFDINTIPQEVSYLSHFSSADTAENVVKFVNDYKAKFGEVPSQFAAGAYDCVYAIYNAMKTAGSEKIKIDIKPEELCDILTAMFDGDFTFSGVTGTNMKWTRSTTGYGYVDKVATKFIVKAASN